MTELQLSYKYYKYRAHIQGFFTKYIIIESYDRNMNILLLFLLLIPFLNLIFVTEARVADEHALQVERSKFRRTIGNVFFGERRYVGFGKFVGSGDSVPIAIDPKSTTMSKLMMATIFHLSLKNSIFLNSWKNVVEGLIKKRQLQRPTKGGSASPSGPTNGWYYGSL